MEYIVLRVQVNFDHSLLRCGWLWVGDNLCLLWDYLSMSALSLEYLLYLPWGPSTNTDFFVQVKNVIWRTQTKSSNNSTLYKTLLGFVGQILIQMEIFFIWGFLQLPFRFPLGSNLCKYAGGHSVTTEACTSLAAVCVVWRPGSSVELSAICWRIYPVS